MVHKKTILLEILNLIKDTMHLYLLVLRLDMDLLYMCLEEQHLMVNTQLILVVIITTYLLVPGTVSAIDNSIEYNCCEHHLVTTTTGRS